MCPVLTVDGCNNYTVLSDVDRVQGHIRMNASNYRCDRDDLVPGWYRFQGAAGDRMADKCVPIGHCGTRNPGWLNGTHPTVSDGAVNRRVCYSDSWYLPSKCCLWSNNIRVRNCGDFFVYELQKPPGCYFRYCGNGSAGKLLCLLLWVLSVNNQSSSNHYHQNILQRWSSAIFTSGIKGGSEPLPMTIKLLKLW